MVTGTEGNDFLTNDPANRHDQIDALGGDDVITIQRPTPGVNGGETVEVNAGDGSDTLIIDTSYANLSGLSATGFDGSVIVRNGSGVFYTVFWTSIERLEITGRFFGRDYTLGDEVDIVRMQAGFGGSIDTGGGNDEIYILGSTNGTQVRANGGAGNDLIDLSATTSPNGGGSPYELTGGEGNDVLRGGAYFDLLDGGAGNDFLWLMDGGTDIAVGGDGNDVFLFGGAMTAADQVDGGSGTDQIALQGNYAGGLTFGLNVIGVENLAILPGNDIRFGDPGTNFYDYNITTRDLNVAAGVQMVVDANRLRLGEDFIFNGASETDGSFFIYGGGGTDLLTGGALNDVFLFGAQGQWGASDVINGGPGGTDQLALRGNYTVTFGAGQLIGIENIGLLSAHDTRFGVLGSSYSYDLNMADANVASGVQMTVDGAKLRIAEFFRFDGSAELDGSFRVFGGLVDDVIIGSQNADLIQGYGGADTLTGGGGADIFRYVATSDSGGSAVDHILDFESGSDKIDLSRIDADTLTAGDQAFSWIGSNAFSGTAGQLRAYQHGATWLVEGDTNGDGTADLVIQLTVTVGPPTQGDFLP